MNKLCKGKGVQKMYKAIIAICLAVALLVTGICLSMSKKDSNADTLDDSIAKHKSVKRDISMKVDASGNLKISKPDQSKNNVKMGKENKWTFFIYVVDVNYGAEDCYKLLNKLKNRYGMVNIENKLDIVIQCCPSNDTGLKGFTTDKQIRAKITEDGFEIIETAEKSNMADADTLYKFLDFGVENYASEHMMVSILGNSGNSFNGRYGVTEDGSYSDGLQIYEIEEAFAKQSKNMTCRFDGIIFNQYDTALVDYANLLSPYVEKMVGLSEASGTNLWDYSVITNAIASNPDVEFEELGKIICDAYDYQCSLNASGKDYISKMVLDIDQSFNEYESSSYGIGLYDLDKVDTLVTSINDVMYDIYAGLSKANDLETTKEFTKLASNCDSYELISDEVDVQSALDALDKLTKIKVDTSNAKKQISEYVLYTRCGEEITNEKKAQVLMCAPLFNLEYTYYPTDKMNFYRNMVVSPYILKTIDYLYASHWGMDVNATYKWDNSKYYFEDNFGFILSNADINNHEGDVSDEMYTSITLNEATYIELLDQKFAEYKEFVSIWKNYINTLDQKRWISLSKSEYKKANKYFANAFMQFKDLQQYWNAYNAAYLNTDKGYIMLGEQTGVVIDNETGIMHSEFEYEWVMLADGQFVRTSVEKNLDKTIYNIPVYMDDEDVCIKIEEKLVNGLKTIEVLGVYDAKGIDKLCDLESGMVVTPIYDIYNIKTSEECEDPNEFKMPWEVEYGDEYTITGKDDLIYGTLPQDEVTCSFAIMKYNGNIYYDVSNLEPLEKMCIVAYTENYQMGVNYNFEVLNNLLRGKEVGEDVNLELANQNIDSISSALQKSQLTEDMTLYRGCSKKTLGEYQDLPAEALVGKTIVEPGFLSTTKDQSVTENFAKGLVITIHAKKGAHGLALSNISQYMSEEEILFDKEQAMVIIAAEERDGVMYVEVTLE